MIDAILSPGPGGRRKPGKSKLGKRVAKEHKKAKRNLTRSFQKTPYVTSKGKQASVIPEIPVVGPVKDFGPKAKNQAQFDEALRKLNEEQ